MLKNSIFGLFVAFTVSSTFAQNVNPFPLSTVRNVTTWQPGELIRVPPGGFRAPINPGDLVDFYTPVKIPSQPGMAEIDGFLRAKVNRPSLGVALGKFASKALPPLGVGVALYDLAKDLGIDASNGPDGKPVFTELVVGQFDGWEFQGQNLQWYKSPTLACQSQNGVPVGSGWFFTGGSNTPSWSAPDTIFQCRYLYCGISGSPCQNQAVTLPQGTRKTTQNASSTRIIPLEQFVDRVIQAPSITHPEAAERLVEDLLDSGEPIQFDPDEVTGPDTTQGEETVKDNGDGTTTTTTTINNHTYQGATVSTTSVTTTVTTNNTTGDVINTTTTTVRPVLRSNPSGESKPFEMPCGLPGKPPCGVKVDESGTPPPPSSPLSQAEDNLDAEKQKVVTAIEENKTLDIGNWTWSFQFPTGCTPITLDMMVPVVLDVCRFQSTIHDLMAMVWAGVGVFGLFSIFRMAVH